MLPASYATPAAAVLALGGLLACFAGYRLFRFVLGMYGLILGAMVTTSWMGASSTWTLVLAAAVGGILGALLMIAAYFVGVGLIGAGLAALALNLVWRLVGGEPPTLVLVIGMRARCPRRALRRPLRRRGRHGDRRRLDADRRCRRDDWAIATRCAPPRPATSGCSIPLDPIPDRWWYTVIWVALSVAGVVVQLATTNKGAGGRNGARRPDKAA